LTRKRYILLYPLSLIFGLITGFRNFLYNTGILKGIEFQIPVICVGNITVGGTGKTPHCEYLISILKEKFKVALLSRGYKRKTSGFVIAAPGSSSEDIGDEPLQIYLKYPGVLVAVDSNRVRGIKNILAKQPDTEIIILDDAFQHRRIVPGLSILLTDHSRLMIKDFLLPYGELRESVRNRYRADIILVTKCPVDMTPIQRRIIVKEMKKAPYQNLFFTTYIYGAPVPVYNNFLTGENLIPDENDFPETDVLLVTGIANPQPLYDYLDKQFRKILSLRFKDHHRFNENDLYKIIDSFRKLPSEKKIILTTEKDAVRLKQLGNIVPDEIMKVTFYIPVYVHFLNDDSEEFNNIVIDYVRKNKRNNRLS